MARFLEVQELYDRRTEAEMLRLAGGSVEAVETAIASAEAEAVSYLLNRYGDRLPASPGVTPGILKDKVSVIAHRRLARGPQIAPALQAEYDEAVKWLGAVARGLASLGLPEAVAPQVDRSEALFLTNETPDEPPPLSWGILRKW